MIDVRQGEGLPDANIYKATLDEFDRQAKSLDADAQEFEPTPSDALTVSSIPAGHAVRRSRRASANKSAVFVVFAMSGILLRSGQHR